MANFDSRGRTLRCALLGASMLAGCTIATAAAAQATPSGQDMSATTPAGANNPQDTNDVGSAPPAAAASNDIVVTGYRRSLAKSSEAKRNS
ncbi:MAG: hypothetical protein ACTHMG_04570, partial [Sphingomonas sp.]